MNEHGAAPDVSMCEDDLLAIWSEDEPKKPARPKGVEPEFDFLLER